jgi:hypothetical protein
VPTWSKPRGRRSETDDAAEYNPFSDGCRRGGRRGDWVGVLATIPVVQRWIYRGKPSGESVRFIEWHRGQSTVAILFIHGLGGCAVPPGQSAESFCPRSAKDSFRSSSVQKSWPEMLAAGMACLLLFTPADQIDAGEIVYFLRGRLPEQSSRFR